MNYQNPILKGFNPDPSICRVGDDYYLVTSSFEYFPAIPVYHSRDLVNWQLISYCLDRDSQVDLLHRTSYVPIPDNASGGIYAPSLCFEDGIFYLTVTNVSNGGNFIVTARDMTGPWSDPVFVKQGGIDPSLFFEDGHVYFSTSALIGETHGIYLCEIDVRTGEMLTDSCLISRGNGGIAPEGPHIFKKDGWYYLLMAEGGTSYGHMVTILRSKDIYGPYESCPRNPVLSHKDSDSSIQCVGHGHMVTDPAGNWWMVCLGIRQLGPSLHNLGRETFLTPLYWDEEGWPVIGKNGTIDYTMDGPITSPQLPEITSFTDSFRDNVINLQYNFIKNPNRSDYQIHTDGQYLEMRDPTGVSLSTRTKSPAFLGIRQKEFCSGAECVVLNHFTPGQKTGITAYYNDSYHYDLYLEKSDTGYQVCLRRQVHDLEVITSQPIEKEFKQMHLKIVADRNFYTFLYGTDGTACTTLGKGMTAGLCSEGTYSLTFVGTYLGMFTECGIGHFDSFTCQFKPES